MYLQGFKDGVNGAAIACAIIARETKCPEGKPLCLMDTPTLDTVLRDALQLPFTLLPLDPRHPRSINPFAVLLFL